jgi:hypothetical protein
MKSFNGAVSAICIVLSLTQSARADVGPLIKTRWGQGGKYQGACPQKGREQSYPGCTSLASAQILYYYKYQRSASRDVSYQLDHAGLSGPDIQARTLSLDLTSYSYDWSQMALDAERAEASNAHATAQFIYHVGVSLNAQFGGGQG